MTTSQPLQALALHDSCDLDSSHTLSRPWCGPQAIAYVPNLEVPQRSKQSQEQLRGTVKTAQTCCKEPLPFPDYPGICHQYRPLSVPSASSPEFSHAHAHRLAQMAWDPLRTVLLLSSSPVRFCQRATQVLGPSPRTQSHRPYKTKRKHRHTLTS